MHQGTEGVMGVTVCRHNRRHRAFCGGFLLSLSCMYRSLSAIHNRHSDSALPPTSVVLSPAAYGRLRAWRKELHKDHTKFRRQKDVQVYKVPYMMGL